MTISGKQSRLSATVTYLWGSTLTTQAMLTPDLASEFPEPRFVMFWGMHVLIVWAAFHVVFGLRLLPTWATYRRTVVKHGLRNALIPLTTVVALGIGTLFGGAIITEQIFRVNGLGQLLITGIQGADLPLVQTLTFIFAVLIVLFNLIADILYGILDPRIRYD